MTSFESIPADDSVRAALTPIEDPNRLIEGADVLDPQTPEQFLQSALHSVRVIANYCANDPLAGYASTETPTAFKHRDAEASVSAAEEYKPKSIAEIPEDQRLGSLVPCRIALINYFEVWDEEHAEINRIVKIEPEIAIADDEEGMDLRRAMEVSAMREAAEKVRPEYTWDSRTPEVIKVQSYQRGEHDLSDPGLVAQLVDGSRFLRRVAIRMAQDRKDWETLATITPTEHNE